MTDPLLPTLASALASLVAYVEGRPDDPTEALDVRALEDVAHQLTALSLADQRRLRGWLPESIADGLGVGV